MKKRLAWACIYAKHFVNKLYLGIRAESVQGQGTTIILDFPISQAYASEIKRLYALLLLLLMLL